MFSEDELLPISLLQHYVFCPRRAALIGIEQYWNENTATMDGKIMHERAHDDIFESRGDIRMRNALHIYSFELGLTGVADVLEFHRTGGTGISIPGAEGNWTPFPVEYKRGTTHEALPYHIQLCAQALCIEEMLHTTIERGAIFWGESRRRQDVEFDFDLRAKTVETISIVRKFIEAGKTPAPKYEKKCKGCSLFDLCMPKEMEKRSVKRYLASFFSDTESEELL